MASAVAPPATAKTTTSVDPLYTAAVAQAKAALAAETAPIQNEQAASDAQYAQRQTDATGVAAALSKLLQPIGPAVNGMYQTAAQNQELAANGFSQGMQDALKGNTDNLNAMLQKLGQPVQLDSHAQQAGDVLYGLGGYTPGKSFSQQGAAFGSAAELQAGDALLRGQENVKDLRAKAIVADQGFQSKIAEMAGKLPGDIQTNYQKLQQLSLQDAKFRESVRKDNIDAAYKQANLKLSAAKYNTSVDEFNARQTLSVRRLNLEAQRMANSQFNSDRSYQLSLAKLGIQQRSLQLRITQDAYKQAHNGFSQKDITKFTEQATSIAQEAVHGSVSYAMKNGVKVPVQSGGVPYFQALGSMLKKGIPVQLALSALDNAYPASARPTDQALANELGPLTPDAVYTKMGNTADTLPGAQGPALGDQSSKVVQVAQKFLGTPYKWGGSTPGKALDCSGFVQCVMQRLGLTHFPRTTYDQVKQGQPVSLQQVQPGDLIFTEPGKAGPNHVGIYIGNGMVQESPHTGDVNKIIPAQDFLSGGFVAARRVLP